MNSSHPLAPTPYSSLISQQQLKLKIAPAVVQRHLTQGLKFVGRAVLAYLTQGHEPKIREIVSQDGHISWRIYDPFEERTYTYQTRSEVRAWLEQRY